MQRLVARARALRHWKVDPHILRRIVRPEPRPGEVLHLGAWPVPRAPTGTIAYCGGVGEEINLELQLIARLGCTVWAFDPTPRAIAFVQAVRPNPERFHFQPYGLWDEDTTLFFALPVDPDHVSATAVGADRARPGFDAPVKRLSSAMRGLGHERIDVLKLNVEGAEEAILAAMLADGIRPGCVTLTFEAKDPLAEARRWTTRLRDEGYRPIACAGWAVTYVRDA